MRKPIKYRGKVFESIRALARAYGVDRPDYLSYKLKKINYDESKIGEILLFMTKPVIKDHKGNIYKSYSQMCREYKIPLSVFQYRLNTGYDLEYCLTAPVRKYS